MYQIFGLSSILRFGVPTGIVVFLIMWWLGVPDGLFRQITVAASVTIILVFLLGAQWGGWRYIWRWSWFKWLNRWLYPDLNGTWRGELRSNWPVILRMARAASDAEEAYDPLGVAPADNTDLQPVPVTLRITASWFSMHLCLETDDDYSSSKTLAVTPIRGDKGMSPALTYVYDNRTKDPKPTDSGSHLGAAWLEITLGEVPILEGQVWTNRNWRKGLNTASLLRVERISMDPEAPVPHGNAGN